MPTHARLTGEAYAYLDRVRTLLTGVDAEVADALITGLAEELDGLGEDETRARIREIGSPEEVTAEARAEARPSAPPSWPASTTPAPSSFYAPPPRQHDADWYTILTALAVTVGGFVVPVIGWIIGVVMLAASRTWRVHHKVIGTLAAPGVVFAGFVPFATPTVQSSPAQTWPDAGGASLGPLLPEHTEETGMLVMVLILAILPCVAIWLIASANRIKRQERPASNR
ncbi:MAG: hypothetical protein QM708_03020 [Propioniciclava sp.]|uniref:hypothetical protein n=1 Tax=Propioniciclava sp. TaxID=2038686 RepID=UPI0039E29E5A